MIRLSLVIPAWNEAERLPRLLDGVYDLRTTALHTTTR